MASVTTANWNVLTHGASAGPPEYGALLATPPGYGIVEGDEIPYLPAAAEQQRRNYENRFKEDPELKCYHAGRAARELHALPAADLPLGRSPALHVSVRGRRAHRQPRPAATFGNRQLDGHLERALGRRHARRRRERASTAWRGSIEPAIIRARRSKSSSATRSPARTPSTTRRRSRTRKRSLARGRCAFACTQPESSAAIDGVQVRAVHGAAALRRSLQAAARVTRSENMKPKPIRLHRAAGGRLAVQRPQCADGAHAVGPPRSARHVVERNADAAAAPGRSQGQGVLHGGRGESLRAPAHRSDERRREHRSGQVQPATSAPTTTRGWIAATTSCRRGARR